MASVGAEGARILGPHMMALGWDNRFLHTGLCAQALVDLIHVLPMHRWVSESFPGVTCTEEESEEGEPIPRE